MNFYFRILNSNYNNLILIISYAYRSYYFYKHLNNALCLTQKLKIRVIYKVSGLVLNLLNLQLNTS